MYNQNYDQYKADLAKYKAEHKVGDDQDQDPAASQLQQDFAGADNSAESSSEGESEDDESESEEDSPSP